MEPFGILHTPGNLPGTEKFDLSTGLLQTGKAGFLRSLQKHKQVVRKGVSSTTLKTLRSVGAFSVAAESRRRRNSLLILCYHGIALADEHKWAPHLYITAAQFRERMQSLRYFGASVLPLDEALERLRTNSLPPRSVAITFDDGFHDFGEHAAPILAAYKYPCTLYLTTHYSGYRIPIVTLVLDYLLWKSGRSFLIMPQLGLPAPTPIRTHEERQAVVKALMLRAGQHNMDTAAKDGMARQLAEHLGVDYEAILRARLFQIMGPEEVQQVVRAGVDVQLHTHRHRTPRDQSLFVKEIEDNRRRIVEMTGKTPVHFCYPSGNYAPEFFRWLQDCGVRSATTCESGLATAASGSMKLPRVLDDSGMNKLRFESVLSGLFV